MNKALFGERECSRNAIKPAVTNLRSVWLMPLRMIWMLHFNSADSGSMQYFWGAQTEFFFRAEFFCWHAFEMTMKEKNLSIRVRFWSPAGSILIRLSHLVDVSLPLQVERRFCWIDASTRIENHSDFYSRSLRTLREKIFSFSYLCVDKLRLSAGLGLVKVRFLSWRSAGALCFLSICWTFCLRSFWRPMLAFSVIKFLNPSRKISPELFLIEPLRRSSMSDPTPFCCIEGMLFFAWF